jgi:hypothetical protein
MVVDAEVGMVHVGEGLLGQATGRGDRLQTRRPVAIVQSVALAEAGAARRDQSRRAALSR